MSADRNQFKRGQEMSFSDRKCECGICNTCFRNRHSGYFVRPVEKTEWEKITAENTSLQAEIKILKAHNNVLKNKNAELSVQADKHWNLELALENNELKKENESLKNQVSGLLDANTHLNNKVKDLTNQFNQKLNQPCSAYLDNKEKIEELKKEYSDLIKHLNHMSSIKQDDRNIHASVAICNDLKSKLIESQRINNAKTEQIKALEIKLREAVSLIETTQS